jgi:hypothetical protein
MRHTARDGDDKTDFTPNQGKSVKTPDNMLPPKYMVIADPGAHIKSTPKSSIASFNNTGPQQAKISEAYALNLTPGELSSNMHMTQVIHDSKWGKETGSIERDHESPPVDFAANYAKHLEHQQRLKPGGKGNFKQLGVGEKDLLILQL